MPDTPAGRRSQVLAALRGRAEPMSIIDIAELLAVHPNTVRFHLESLVEAGRAERVETPPTGRGRPPLMFRAVRRMDAGGPRNYRLLAQMFLGELESDPDPVTRATEMGRRWGRTTEIPGTGREPARHRFGRVLDEIGFDTEFDGDEIRLRHCPFLDLVDTDLRVICPIHLGLMQGVIGRLDSSATVRDLQPFAEPDVCVARLDKR
jgi:predicted ArsR family transcriptional regulator